jgi:hypothetical protein
MAQITVACKVPNGLLLRNFKLVDRDEAVAGGGYKTVKRAEVDGSPVKINGPRVPFNQAPAHTVLGGYAFTPGVDSAFFERWLKDNADHPAVVNNLIFASDKAGTVEGKAKEFKALKTGLEPLHPAGDPRLPKGGTNITVSIADKD